MDPVSKLFLELGLLFLGLALLGLLARRLGLSPVPFVLLAAVALGDGGREQHEPHRREPQPPGQQAEQRETEEEQAELQEQLRDRSTDGALVLPVRCRSSCSRPASEPMATRTSPACSRSPGRGDGRRRRRARSPRSSTRSACGPGCDPSAVRRTVTPADRKRADSSPGTSRERSAKRCVSRAAPSTSATASAPPGSSRNIPRALSGSRWSRPAISAPPSRWTTMPSCWPDRVRARTGRRRRVTGSPRGPRPHGGRPGRSGKALGEQLGSGADRCGRRAGRAACGRRTRRPGRRRRHRGPFTAGSSCCSATATDASWWPRSTPQLPASPQQPPRRVTVSAPGAGEQRGVGRPAHHRVVVAVGWRHHLEALQPNGGRVQPGVSPAAPRACGWPRRPRSPSGPPTQVERVAAQHRGARGSDADDRHTRRRDRGQRAHRLAEDPAGGVELAGGDPGQPAAGVVVGHLTRYPAASSTRAGDRDLGAKWSVNESTTAPPGCRRRPGKRARPTRRAEGAAGERGYRGAGPCPPTT